MILSKLQIINYRSIKDTGEFPIKNIFALVGENNSGKSNIIKSVESFVGAGASGVTKDDFNDPNEKIIIKGTFTNLSKSEIKRWKSYLVKDQLILEKQIWLEIDNKTSKEKVKSEFHGYKAEPKEWFLSIPKIEERFSKPKWIDIVNENNLPEYFIKDGKCNTKTYKASLEKYIEENDVEFDEPDISATQALGLQSNVVAFLPSVYLLEAITDYSDEIDRRSSNTTFRRLMGDLSDRILKNDPKYKEIESSINKIKSLFNKIEDDSDSTRLESLGTIEEKIKGLLKKLMPSVKGVSLSIIIDEIKDMFSRGVSISIDDGIETDVLDKGHGLQRCIVFTLLQTLIMNERNQLFESSETEIHSTIILAIEEPELYIHPQLCKLFFDVMREFSETDQVLYATHSPLFIDAFDYDKIGIVKKENTEIGTKIKTCSSNAFDDLDERKIFKGLTKFNPSINEMFFAKKVLIVEGSQDQIAVTKILQNEDMIINRIEELDWSIVVAGGKNSIPFFQRVLNSFDIPYTVLHDFDIVDGMNPNDKNIHEKTNRKIKDLSHGNPIHSFPVKLEVSLGLDYHLNDQYYAHKFFQNSDNITDEVKTIILNLFK